MADTKTTDTVAMAVGQKTLDPLYMAMSLLRRRNYKDTVVRFLALAGTGPSLTTCLPSLPVF